MEKIPKERKKRRRHEISPERLAQLRAIPTLNISKVQNGGGNEASS